jgi:cytochrome c
MRTRHTLVGALAAVLLLSTVATAAEVDGDPEHGKEVYDRCVACHSLERNRTGPKHCGLFGRRAGELPKYRFSKALQAWGKVWTPETLDTFIEDPLGTVPGTRMGYAGVKDPKDRADLIAYLVKANESPENCPK